MKNQFKKPINNFAPVFLMMVTMFLFGFGCNTSKPSPDPLAGWHYYDRTRVNQAITDDYQDYIQKLPTNQKGAVGDVSFVEDGTGQHAVSIQIFEEGNASWQHVLIYDKENKRIKVIRYDYRKYQS